MIKEAAKLSNDETMLMAIHGYKSLRAAEFRIHAKCYKDYTRICPPKKIRIKCIDSEKIEGVLSDSEENRSNCESKGTMKDLKESCSKEIEDKLALGIVMILFQ